MGGVVFSIWGNFYDMYHIEWNRYDLSKIMACDSVFHHNMFCFWNDFLKSSGKEENQLVSRHDKWFSYWHCARNQHWSHMQKIETLSDLVRYGTLFDWLFMVLIVGIPIYLITLILLQHVLGCLLARKYDEHFLNHRISHWERSLYIVHGRFVLWNI